MRLLSRGNLFCLNGKVDEPKKRVGICTAQNGTSGGHVQKSPVIFPDNGVSANSQVAPRAPTFKVQNQKTAKKSVGWVGLAV